MRSSSYSRCGMTTSGITTASSGRRRHRNRRCSYLDEHGFAWDAATCRAFGWWRAVNGSRTLVNLRSSPISLANSFRFHAQNSRAEPMIYQRKRAVRFGDMGPLNLRDAPAARASDRPTSPTARSTRPRPGTGSGFRFASRSRAPVLPRAFHAGWRMQRRDAQLACGQGGLLGLGQKGGLPALIEIKLLLAPCR